MDTWFCQNCFLHFLSSCLSPNVMHDSEIWLANYPRCCQILMKSLGDGDDGPSLDPVSRGPYCSLKRSLQCENEQGQREKASWFICCYWRIHAGRNVGFPWWYHRRNFTERSLPGWHLVFSVSFPFSFFFTVFLNFELLSFWRKAGLFISRA